MFCGGNLGQHTYSLPLNTCRVCGLPIWPGGIYMPPVHKFYCNGGIGVMPLYCTGHPREPEERDGDTATEYAEMFD